MVWFNIKMAFYQCRGSLYGDDTAVRPPYLYNWTPYIGKMISSYWISHLVINDIHIKYGWIMYLLYFDIFIIPAWCFMYYWWNFLGCTQEYFVNLFYDCIIIKFEKKSLLENKSFGKYLTLIMELMGNIQIYFFHMKFHIKVSEKLQV